MLLTGKRRFNTPATGICRTLYGQKLLKSPGKSRRQRPEKGVDAMRNPSWLKVLLVVLPVAAGLGGCSSMNPINWGRSATGTDKSDTLDQEARNTANLEAGGQAPYPNLGSVPPPPDRALSTVDREKLQKGLVADRANAKYSDEELHAGHAVPPLPGEPPKPEEVASAAPMAGAAEPPAAAQTPAPAPAGAGNRKGPPAKGSAQPPQESSLASPSVRSLPQGEAPHAPPPPPADVPQSAQAAQPPATPRQQAALPPPALPAPRAAAGAAPRPPVMTAPRGRGAAITLAAAELTFAADGKTLTPEDNRELAEVARLYKEGGGRLRIIGYGRPGQRPDAAAQELAGFDAALDRANAAAQALAKLGVPASRITIQAAPAFAAAGPAEGQVEVLLEY
jgi:outer membrane protein OmpA-like peptidoglycan-associated protein